MTGVQSRLLISVIGVVALGLVAAEALMDPTGRDRAVLTAIFAGAGAITVFLYWCGTRLANRLGSVSASVSLVAVSSVLASTIAVLFAAGSMFLSEHDRNLVLVALGLGVGLGVAAAFSVSSSLVADIGRVATAADAVAAGRLQSRSGVQRRDEVGRLASAFDEMAARLEATENERRFMFQSIGHDLRTPLASIRAAVEAIEDGLAPDPARYLEGIGRDVTHLATLVEDLTMLASLDSGTYVSRPEPVDMTELADDAVDSLMPLARARSVGLEVVASGRVQAAVDPAAYTRILRNLVENAIRHAPSNSVVSVEVLPGVVRVVDSGPGFPDDFKEIAFERFTRAEPARSSSGSGLGLSIAKALVEAGGGRISIEDGPGARVLIEL